MEDRRLLSSVATTTALSTSQTSVVYGTPVTLTAIISASTGTVAPAQGSVDFKDTTTNTDFGNGTFATSAGTTSTWTFATGVKTFNVTAGDTIQASYAPGTGFIASSGTTTQTIIALPITVNAATNTKVYDGTTVATATPTVIAGGVVTTLAGSVGSPGSSDGTGSTARFYEPSDVAVDSVGNVYVADWGSQEIRKITPSGVVTTLAGSAGATGSVNGTGSAARFDFPEGVAVDSVGNVYVADTNNDEIREITPSGVVTTLAGSGGQGSSNGTGTAARFYEPTGVAVDSAGNVYVADEYNAEIREITPSGVVTTLAGSVGHSGSSDGSGSAARFDDPTGVAVDSAGNIYVADEINEEIRKITPSGVVTTLAGSDGQAGSTDGALGTARFHYPMRLALDSVGDVYVADSANYEIREIIPSGVVVTLAGSPGQDGSSNGVGSAASFSFPEGVAVDSAGNVYVAGNFNCEIRLVKGTVAPVSGDMAAFSEAFGNRNVGSGKGLSVTGSVNDGNGGNNYTVTFLASTSGSIAARAITVTAMSSTKGYDGTVSATATPTVTTGSLAAGDAAAFTETFTNKNAGTSKTLTPTGSVNDSNSGNNYAVTFVANTGQIAARAITVTAAPNTKVYDGTTFLAVTPTISSGSLATGDTLAFTESYDTKNVGTGKTATAVGSVNDGDGGADYAVTFVANTTGQITPLAITVTAATSTKGYDGIASSTATPMIGAVVSTMAGSGASGSSDGTGSTARFDEPSDVAVDGAGNVYVADKYNDDIRKITPSGVVTTLAGCPGQSGSGNGTGSAARFYEPEGVAVDSAGNVYVADTDNDEIREITPSGVVTTLAGSAGQGSSNGTGTAAKFYEPTGVAVDSAGNVYVADEYNAEIREITPSGVVTTLAGSVGHSGSSDGSGSAARFNWPAGVAVDSAGNVYVADEINDDIRKITPSGVVTTLAGSAGQSGSSDGAASTARFDDPMGVALDSAGDVYVADNANDEIRKIVPSGVVITLAGSPRQNGSSNGVGSAARFSFPEGVAVDSAGNVYVADNFNCEIRLVSGGSTSLAGGDTAAFSESFDTRNAGTGKTLTAAGSVNDGNGGSNYSVTFAANTTGQITARAITVTAATNTKGYDGTTSTTATPTISGGSLGTGDTAAFTETLDTRNVGTGKSLLVAGSVNDGNSGNNYTVTRIANANGLITALAITVTAATSNKGYDGTTSSTATPTITNGSLAMGDTPAFSEIYDTQNAGTGKTLTLVGSINDGNGGNNYTVSTVNNYTGAINQAVLTITATANTKTYDGTTAAGATPAVNGLQGSDSVTGLVEAYADADAGTGKNLSVSGYTVNDGNAGGNYTISLVATAAGVINRANAAILVTPYNLTYDGASHTATGSATGVLGESLGGLDLSGTTHTGAGTYTDGWTFIDTTGDYNNASGPVNDSIGQASLTITATANTKNYDGTVSAAVKPTIITGSLAAGDVAAFSESYDNPNAGTGKTLTPSGSVNDGNGGNDYAVTFVVNTTGAINAVTATAAKLMITETSSSTVVSGHDVVYTITLKNLGPGTAQNVVVSDNLAASGLTYVSDPVPAGCTASTPAVGCTGMVTFTAPSLAAGASATFTLVAGVGSTAPSNSSLSNKVTVCCATPLSGGSVTAASVQAQVNAVGAGLSGSSLGTGQTDLVVTGTAGSDTIYVLSAAGNQILVLDDGRTFGPFAAPTGRIVVYGGNGNDMVYVSPLLTESSWIFGGAGNDVFYADSGNSVLVGGSGNNVLVSGRGDNILIGGCGGRSTILGAQGNNIEIGGSVNCEANEAALAAILAEWSSGDSYATRVGRLDGIIGGGLNGSWLLDASTIDHGPGCDYLFGGSGQNTYFARRTGPVLARDYIFAEKSSEQITPV